MKYLNTYSHVNHVESKFNQSRVARISHSPETNKESRNEYKIFQFLR